MVIPRFGVTTIIPGLVPAEIGEIGRKMSFSASTIYTPASEVPALTLLEMKARYLRPLVLAPLGAALPQLSQVRVAGSRNNKKIGIRFKRRTPTSCRIITWMQEEDYSKGRNSVWATGRNACDLIPAFPESLGTAIRVRVIFSASQLRTEPSTQ